ncbi:MAG: hypothetical protein JJU00_09980 [Opitutales bacterium]|nr:hypothetical protein [Opitutales bacterium]
MKKLQYILGAFGALAVAAASVSALEVTVSEFVNGEPIPPGYVEVVPEVPDGSALMVSEPPFVDYLIPANSGSPAVIAMKEGGQYLSNPSDPDIFSNAGSGGSGANSFAGGDNPDLWHVVFTWDDGTPVPFEEDFYGVSWANWNVDTVAEMTTRVDLPDDNPVKVWHFFNDGWDYAGSGHNAVDGHILTVAHYNASGVVVAEESVTLSGGNATDFYGDNRGFYTAEIVVQRQAEGDYVLIGNTGGNIGYKGTVVELLEADETDPEWAGIPLIDGWADTGDFMGLVYPVGDFVYVWDLQGWLYLPEDHVGEDGAWAFFIR